jgi:hypothetical protein
MPGFTNNDNSIANGIPARYIGPETGSFGSATMSNKGGTSEGSNEASDSIPAPAAGLETPISTGEHHTEERSFAARPDIRQASDDEPIDADHETAAQQMADGGDRIKHDHKDHDRR